VGRACQIHDANGGNQDKNNIVEKKLLGDDSTVAPCLSVKMSIVAGRVMIYGNVLLRIRAAQDTGLPFAEVDKTQ
jgi:hypothetical protein